MRYDGDDLERRGIAAHDDGDGVVALLGPVDADAVPRPGRIRTGPIGGWTRLAAPGVFEIARGDVCAERGVEHPLHGGRVDGASFGTGFLEFVLDGPHGAGQLATLPRDLVLGQPPVGCERFPIAPLVDGPAQLGRPTPHGRDRAIGMLMGGAHHGLCPHAVAVHGLALGGFQNPELHLVDLVEQQARGVAPRTAVCEAFRAWIVLPQAKLVLVRPGAEASQSRGMWPAAHNWCRRSTTRADCWPEPPRIVTSVSKRMALAAASSASREVLPPKPRDAIHNTTELRARKASRSA